MSTKEKSLSLFDNSEVPDVKESALQHLRTIIQSNEIESLEKVQNFLVMLNQEPPKGWLKKHPYISVKRTNLQTGRKENAPYEYLPVERCEQLLNRLYFGQWSTVNFRWQQIFNEITGSIDLILLDPVTGREITRTGAASIVIMQDKDAKVADFNQTKKANALETGFPKLKSECFKNACKSIGNLFGANVGRDTDNILYVPMITSKNREQLLKTALG